LLHAFIKKTQKTPVRGTEADAQAFEGVAMAELKYTPVVHDRKAFLAKARSRKGFTEAYDALALEYQVADQMLKARSRAGLTQDAVAELMGTTKSAISRLESAGKHAPSIATLKRYALAVGCELQVKLVPQKA
jgi:DNA-binding XRE family transcriptional regulator